MAWTLGKMKLPSKKNGNKLEASYINGVLAEIMLFLNSLVDAQTVFESSSQHRVNGLQYLPIGETQERYAVQFSDKTFTAEEQGDEDKELFVLAKDILNNTLPLYDAIKDKDGYLGSTALERMKTDWQNRFGAIPTTENILNALAKELLDRLLNAAGASLEDIFKQQVKTVTFTFSDEV